MIYSISWKTYFVFMCINFAFVPVIWWTFVETKGYPLEKLDSIFEEAYEKGENPVWTEKRVRREAKQRRGNEGKRVEEGVSSGVSVEGEGEEKVGGDMRRGPDGQRFFENEGDREKVEEEEVEDRTDRFPEVRS